MSKQLRNINNAKRFGQLGLLCIQDFNDSFLKPYVKFRFSEYLSSTNEELMRAKFSF